MRAPSNIIGNDAYMQLISEGYVVVPARTVADLKDCVETAISGPRRSVKMISKKAGDMEPITTVLLKGQVLRAIRALNEI